MEMRGQFQKLPLPVGHLHLSLSGTPFMTESTWAPHPPQVVLLHLEHWTFQHMIDLIFPMRIIMKFLTKLEYI